MDPNVRWASDVSAPLNSDELSIKNGTLHDKQDFETACICAATRRPCSRARGSDSW
ncbi:MAG: hypothetical protein ACLT8E_00460 [Akkermansia sp.]